MSNFRQAAYHPVRKRIEAATWFDDYFGHHEYGVRFDADGQEGEVFRQKQVIIPLDGRLCYVPAEDLEAMTAERDALSAEVSNLTVEVAMLKIDSSMRDRIALTELINERTRERDNAVRSAQEQAQAVIDAYARIAQLEEALRRGNAACDHFDAPASDNDFVNGQATAAQQIRAELTAGDLNANDNR